MDLTEGRAIAPVVAARLAKGDSAAVKHLPHNGGDFADAVILPVVTDVEDFVMNCLARSFESKDDRLTNVVDMDQWSPRCSIAGHLDLFDGPRKAGEIVEDNIETHSRTGAECRCVAQEHGRKMGICERADIAAPGRAGGAGGLPGRGPAAPIRRDQAIARDALRAAGHHCENARRPE